MIYDEGEGFTDHVKKYKKLQKDSSNGDDICEQLKKLKQEFRDCVGLDKDIEEYIGYIDKDLKRLNCPK